MVGSALKRYALEKEMTVRKGVAFGVYQGYMLTMKEGMGWKMVTFAVNLSDEQKTYVEGWLENNAQTQPYRVQKFWVTRRKIAVQFRDTTGTMKVIRAFVEAFTTELVKQKVPGAECCNFCGQTEEQGQLIPVLVNGTVFLSHDGCDDVFNQQMEERKESEEARGSVWTGLFGSLVGGLLGAIPWTVLSFFGWFVGWFGLLIGWCAKKGYELCRGKENRWKLVSVIVVTLLMVVVAEFATYYVALTIALRNDPELSQWSFSFLDTLRWLFAVFAGDASVRVNMLIDIALGWAFSALNIFFLVKDVAEKTGKNYNQAIRL